MHPFTALLMAGIHVYLSVGHLLKLFSGVVLWTHVWKGFGALAGAYVFAALASRGFARRLREHEERLDAYSLVEGGHRRKQ